MCKGLRDMQKEWEEKGAKQGIEKGIEKTSLRDIRSLMKSLGLTAAQAMDALMIEADKREMYLQLI